MKASYSYVLLSAMTGGGMYQTNIGVLAESEEEARKKAIKLIGANTADKVAKLNDELKLIQVMDIELLKQRLEQSFVRDMPDWLREHDN